MSSRLAASAVALPVRPPMTRLRKVSTVKTMLVFRQVRSVKATSSEKLAPALQRKATARTSRASAQVLRRESTTATSMSAPSAPKRAAWQVPDMPEDMWMEMQWVKPSRASEVYSSPNSTGEGMEVVGSSSQSTT